MALPASSLEESPGSARNGTAPCLSLHAPVSNEGQKCVPFDMDPAGFELNDVRNSIVPWIVEQNVLR